MKPFYTLAYFVCQSVSRVVFHVSVRGREHIPKSGPFIAASNHISYYDPALIGSLLKKEMAFFAKAELFDNLLLKGLIKKLNAFPVMRGKSSVSSIKTCIRILQDRKMPLLIFPEGTRIKTGTLGTPQRGIAFIAAQTKVPVLPIYLENSDRLHECALFLKKLKVRIGKAVTYGEYGHLVKGTKGYSEVAELIMSRIESLKNQN